MADNKNILQSVENALSVIDLFETEKTLSLAEISKRLNVGKTTAFRLCNTLCYKGYLRKDLNSRYELGPRLFSLGNAARDHSSIIQPLRPYLISLMEQTGETIHLVIWADNTKVILIDQVVSQASIRVKSEFTPRYAHLTSTGLVLLAAKDDASVDAYLQNIPMEKRTLHTLHTKESIKEEIAFARNNGYAINNQQFELGLISIAVPIRNSSGNIFAAISSSGPDSRIAPKMDLIIYSLKAAAKEIEKLPL